MKRLLHARKRLLVTIAAALIVPAIAAGELVTTLEAAVGGRKQTASSDRPGPGAAPRAVFQAAADQAIALGFQVRNPGPEPRKDVLVHYFVVSEDRVGHPAPTTLRPSDVVLEGALTMDFGATNAASGTLVVRVHAPGAYLVQVEPRYATATGLAPPAAALDLVVR